MKFYAKTPLVNFLLKPYLICVGFYSPLFTCMIRYSFHLDADRASWYVNEDLGVMKEIIWRSKADLWKSILIWMYCIEKSCIVGMNALVTSLLLFQMKLMERETLYLFQRWALSALLLVGRIFIELIDHKSCTTICSHLYNLLEAKFLNLTKRGLDLRHSIFGCQLWSH